MASSDLSGIPVFGTLAAGTSALPLTTDTPCKEVAIINPHATETIYVGDVNSQPWPIKAGDPFSIPAKNATSIYVRTSSSSISVPYAIIK